MVEDIDPFDAQMWHYSFDPHSVEQIPLADLKLPPKTVHQRSESVSEFLNRSNIKQNLVKEALSKSVIRETT